MKNSKVVFENQSGQTVRTIQWTAEKMIAIYRIDTRRLEFVDSTEILEADKIPFTTIKEIHRNDLNGRRIPVSHVGYLRIVNQDEMPPVREDVQVLPEDTERFPVYLKKTAVAHVAMVLIFLLSGWVITKYFSKAKEPITVTVFEQKREDLLPRKTVDISKRKITPKRNVKAKAAKKTKIRRTVVARTTKKSNGQGRAGNGMMNTGALSVLGGMDKKFNGAGGLNTKATKNNPGVGYGGSAARGGFERGLVGKGLVASGIGNGGDLKGYGGYGTKGQGGGRPGYGSMKIAGGSGAYFEPLTEEALIDGGLDLDQINAVVQRNLGQIYYCYEQGLQRKPSLSGRVDVKFVIGPKGIVNTARVSNTSLGENKVEGCIVQKLRGWKFPKPVGDVNVRVELPFLLKRLSQG